MEKIKIVVDSSADLVAFDEIDFASAPLKIITKEREFIDNDKLDVLDMVNYLKQYRGKSSTSCPNVIDWLGAFGDAKRIICITITGTLSGSFNSASIAARQYMECNPERRVFVINSLTAGPEIMLIVEKAVELIKLDYCFEDVCSALIDYKSSTGLLFILESMRNLANNGRVNPIIAGIAGLLGIRAIGKASDKGDLEQLDKCRGEVNTVKSIIKQLHNLGYKGGKIRIGHCFNEGLAVKVKDLIISDYPDADIEIYQIRGLCSFYAEHGGLMIGFEKM